MAEKDSNTLVCKKCQTEYPPDTPICPADQGHLVPACDPLVGTLFADKYEILSIIGVGGMSKVYKARHTLMKRIVAVKLLHEEATEDPAAKQRFQREAEAASALAHANVVTVHDFGLTPTGQAYFIMDCLEGESLEEILEQEGCLELEHAIDVFSQACDGLEHAHRKGIIHRDIKPSNFVLTKQDDGTELVKLVDFGIAKVVNADNKDKSLTQTGEVFGSPAYMSPEQGSGKAVDLRSDLYSFGCSMYEALVGVPPFLGENFISTVVKHVNEPPKPLAEVAPHRKIPAQIEAVVLKCLAKNPDERYRSAAELKKALLDAAYHCGLKGARKSPGGGATAERAMHHLLNKRERKWRTRAAIVAGIIGLILTGAGWYIFIDSGTAGDGGTVWEQIVWQSGISQAEALMRDGKYDQAQKVLEKCLIQADEFDDDSWRELTLNRLVDAADKNHDFATQKKANEMLVAIADGKVYKEYDWIMEKLQEWQQPTGEILALEKQQRAFAFGDRISKLSDELAKRSIERQQLLLSRAISAYDALDLERSVPNLRFRLALAESYRTQQRFDDVIPLLTGSLDLFSKKLKITGELQLKVRTLLMLGQSERIQADSPEELERAGKYLEQALALSKEVTPPDPKMVGDCASALAIYYRLYHKPRDDAKAAALESSYKHP